ncbi:retrovirus-related pol polyprotein from transposon TNT 1-94 [Tanacetum coccineum]|uniref:Retrovirus-related pol polyprotein from transposon TNT 1-94 n=1 Tax=Tanacetum coccineum TaxID=301880 RepID=A0ABQ5CFL0_9ASTR
MEELTVAVMLIAQIQPTDGNAETVPSYDAKAVSEVNASSKGHEQVSHVKCKTIIQTSDDDQIDSNIIFDGPYVDNNGGTSEHDSNAHDKYHEIQIIQKNEMLNAKLEKSLNDSKDIQTNLLKRIKILENDFKRSQAQSIDFELKLQHQKEKMACDVSWKSKLSTTNAENVLLKTQVDSVVKERENIKLEYQKLFNLIKVIQLVLWIVDSRCSKHTTGNFQLLRNFVEKIMGTVCFGNDHFAAIIGYGDYVQGNLMICHVYYVEGLGHNLFLSHINKSGLWHRRLSHLNSGTINQLTSKDLVDLLSKFKYNKDHLCSACEQGKSKKASLPSKLVPSTESKLELLHMDLCGPMCDNCALSSYACSDSLLLIPLCCDDIHEVTPCVSALAGCDTIRVASINGKKYILVTVDDYSRYTWVYFLRIKDEAPDMIIDFINQVQRNLKAQILTIRTNNGTEFKNEKLWAFYAKLVLNENTDELVQEDVVDFDGNVFYNAPPTLIFEEAESSSTYQDPSNMTKFHQKHRSMSTIKPKNIKEAMLDSSWIESMQDKLNRFKRLDVWELIEYPIGRNIIAVKWIWKNKTDAENTVIQNKSCLVAKGYDPDFPNHVYHLKKALYGLKQAPRAWYDKLSSFLIKHHFTKGIVDPTLFTRRHGDGILLVQIYVDDIIFGSTKPAFSIRFAKLMKDNFKMSMIGEVKFFLGLQVHQSPQGIFICQSQTIDLKKHGMEKCDTISKLIATVKLDADLQVFHIAQQVVPAAQLVPRYHTITRCNNYVVLQCIPCSPECTIVGKILLDYPLCYALTATADVPIEAIQYPRFIKLMIADLMKKFLNIPQRIDEDYHSIKDDIFHWTPTITAAIPRGKKRKQTTRESSSPRKSHKITIKKKKQSTTLIPPPDDDQERDEVAEVSILSLTLHKTVLVVEAQENIAIIQEKLDEEEIEKMVEDSKSHKEHPKIVNDDDDDQIEKEKKDEEIKKEKKYKEIEKEKNINDVEKTDEVVKEKDIDVATGSMEFRKEKKQTPIPSLTRSPRKVSSSNKIVSEELIATVSPTTATKSKRKKESIHIRRRLFHEIREVLDHCNKVVPELTFAKTNEMINKEMPCLVNLAVNKDRKVDTINTQELFFKEFATHAPKMIKELFRKHMHNTTLNLYPTTSSSVARKSMGDLQQQLYLNMKSKPQDQAADPELWEILKVKFEKQYLFAYHNEHHRNADPPEGVETWQTDILVIKKQMRRRNLL